LKGGHERNNALKRHRCTRLRTIAKCQEKKEDYVDQWGRELRSGGKTSDMGATGSQAGETHERISPEAEGGEKSMAAGG